jgi:PEP-CTERM motif
MRRQLMVLVAAFVLALTLGSAAKADTVSPIFCIGGGLACYNQPSAFPANDYVHWGQIGATGTTTTSPFTVSSDNGLSIMGTTSNGGGVERSTECNVSGCNWAGNFAPGSALLWTDPNGAGAGNGPLTFTFAQPVSGVGFQIQADYYGNFVGEIQVYDGLTLLGYATELGNSNGNEDNSAIFLGIVDLNGAEITSVKLGTFDCALNCKDFSIGKLSLDTSAPAVPEPGTLMLLSSGLFGVLGLVRSKLS